MSPLLRFLLATLVLLALVRWALAATLEVTPEEAYVYQLASHRTWLGCDGGGGMVVALLATWLGKSALALRFWMPLVALGTSWLLFRMVVKMAGERAASWAVVMLNLLPAFNFGAILLQPEWLAALLGLAGIQWLWTGLHRAGTWDWRWLASGVAWGVALQAHGTALSLPISLGFLLLASRRWRKRLLRPGPWMLLGAWLLTGVAPLLWWNAQHAGALMDQWLVEWGWGRLDWRAGTRGFFRQAMAGISPLLLLAAGWALLGVLRRKPREDAPYFLLAFTLPGFALLAGLAMLGMGNAAGWVPLVPPLCGLLAIVWQPSTDLRERRNWWQWAALGTAALLTLCLLNTDLLRRAGLVRTYRGDRARHWLGWKTTALETTQIIQEAAAQFPPGLLLIAETPQLAAALDFHLPDGLPVLTPQPGWPRVQVMESPASFSQYAFWPRYDEEDAEGGKEAPASFNALFFTEVTERIGPPEMLRQSFGEVTPVMVFEVNRHGMLLRRIKVFACRDYHGSPL